MQSNDLSREDAIEMMRALLEALLHNLGVDLQASRVEMGLRNGKTIRMTAGDMLAICDQVLGCAPEAVEANGEEIAPAVAAARMQ